MTKTWILARNYEKARAYAKRYGYSERECVGMDINPIRGVCMDRIIILEPLTDQQARAIAPAAIGAEILYANEC